MKKSITLLITAFIVFGYTFAFSGCSSKKLLTDGYFTYHNINNKFVEIVGLSELGKQQEYLVIPNEIQGLHVGGISDKAGLIWGYRDTYWESDKLAKIYFPQFTSITYDGVFSQCSSLTKYIRLSSRGTYPDYFVEDQIYKIHTYMTSKEYFRFTTSQDYTSRSDKDKYRPANISFYWNYENADNDGYYWIDDIDYGEHITLIPDDPARSGYTFTGWYKEPECINLWDFESDTAPAPQFDSDLNTIYRETCLYAGWR